MIELASEATVQQVTRTDQNQAFNHKDTVQHETQKVIADRPVEKSEESVKAKRPRNRLKPKPDTTWKTTVLLSKSMTRMVT